MLLTIAKGVQMDINEILANVDKAKLKEALASDDPDALRELLASEGIDLTDEQMDHIAGGFNDPIQTC